jgi:hypothetical protein
MYIRTECGMIVSLEDGYYEVNGEQLIDEKYGRWEIKSQGDNLIDVLEMNDIVIISGDMSFLLGLRTHRRLSGKHLNSGKVVSISLEGIDILRSETKTAIVGVITTEQYLPLAQEVK